MTRSNPPAPFASVRSSRDHSLVAFVGAVLVASALSAGVFLPPLSSPSGGAPAAVETASARASQPVVAHRPPAARRGVAAAAPAEPCATPRG